MISVVSRWRWQGEDRIQRVRLASGDGGAVVLDGKGRIVLLDVRGAAVWTRNVEDSVRDIGIAAAGKEAYALSVREVVRFGTSGKALWHVPPPPFPVRLSIRRDGEVFAIAAGQGLVRLFDAATGRDMGGQRVKHAADHLALLAVELADPTPPKRGAKPPGPPVRPTLTCVVSERGDVTLLDHLGQPHWTVSLGATSGAPDAAHDRVVVPSFDGVHSFLLDGTPAGLYDVGAPVVRAQLDDGASRILVLDAKNRLFLLAAQTGETLWHLALPEDTADVSFAADGGAIAIALRSGAVERLQVIDGNAQTGVGSAGGFSFGNSGPATMPSPAAIAHAPGGFLEMPDEDGLKIRPKVRWRVPVSAQAPQIALLRSGEGIALLDAPRGELALWTGNDTPAWRASGLGAGSILAAGVAGDPIVVAGPAGIRFFSFDRGPIGKAALQASSLAVAASGAAVLAGSASQRLHLFDGEGNPVWDVPTPGFRRLGISPSGNELAIARVDGNVVFQVRGRQTPAAGRPKADQGGTTGWTQTLGGTGFLTSDEDVDTSIEMLVLEDGLLFATAGGRAGFVAADGTTTFDGRIPGGHAAADIVTVAGQHLLRDATGAWSQFLKSPWKLVPLANVGGGASSQFAMAMDRLLEFRYDSKEIASVDASTGTVIWKRALSEAPKAVAVAADGSCLAAVVSGELVLYDLISDGPAAAASPDAQRFLEL